MVHWQTMTPVRRRGNGIKALWPIVIVAMFVSHGTALFAQSAMIPHVTSPSGGFSTSLILENLTDRDVSVSLVSYQHDGQQSGTATISVLAHTVRQYPVEDLFTTGVVVSHFVIINLGDAMAASAAYQVANGVGTPAHVGASTERAKRWRLFPGDWNVVFDGIAVVNTGDEATAIEVRQLSENGSLLQSETAIQDLQPQAKGLYVIGAPGEAPFTAVTGSIFEVIGETELAITALRGSPPNAPVGYLWENVALPLSPQSQGPIQFRIEGKEVTFQHHAIKLHLDGNMNLSVGYKRGGSLSSLVQPGPSAYMELATHIINDFRLDPERVDHQSVTGPFGKGQRVLISGRSAAQPVDLTLVLELYETYPNTVLVQSRFQNMGSIDLAPSAFWTNHLSLDRRQVYPNALPYDFHTLSMGTVWGNGTADRIYRIGSQSNFDNRNGGDVSNPDPPDGVGQWGGGGTPITSIWSPEMAITQAVVEPEITIVAVPVETAPDGQVQTGVKQSIELGVLKPLDVWSSHWCSITVHSGDFFDGIAIYGQMLRDLGLQTRQYSEVDYAPHWDSFGLDERLEMGSAPGDREEVDKRLYIARDLGLTWIAIDSGWDDGTGSFAPNSDYYDSEEDFVDWIDDLHDRGFNVSLWLDPGFGDEDMVAEHPDWFIINDDGSYWMDDWERFAMDPTVPEAIDYVQQGVEKLVTPQQQGGWGIDRLFLDGTFLTPPDYSGRHESPHDTECSGDVFYQQTFEIARDINPDFPIEFCPCGGVISAWLLPTFSTTSTSDPDDLSLRTHEVRTKIYKALVGPDAPVNGDHIEGAGEDLELDMNYMFPLVLGIGAIYQTYYWEEAWRPSDPHGVGVRDLYRAWFTRYDQLKLSQGTYLNLYDLAYDQPGSHAIARGEDIYYLFAPPYDQSYSGTIELRGLNNATYIVRDYENNIEWGSHNGPTIKFTVTIPKNNPLLLVATPK